jgi:hypothetical protein
MSTSQVGAILLAVQIVMVAMTAIIVPMRMDRRASQYLIYTVFTAVLWIAYALVAMQYFLTHGIDVIAFGYIALGFLMWVVGTIVYTVRTRRQNKIKLNPEPNNALDRKG